MHTGSCDRHPLLGAGDLDARNAAPRGITRVLRAGGARDARVSTADRLANGGSTA